MKTKPFPCSIAVAFILAAFPVAGCAEKEPDQTATAPLPAAPESAPVAPAPEPVVADEPAARWTSLKNLPYEQRVRFIDGIGQLEARVDEQLGELTARRAAMPDTANTADWDFAMKEMNNARAYLRGMSEEMDKATRDNWSQRQDHVGLAWERTQDAYGKVKSSTTQ